MICAHAEKAWAALADGGWTLLNAEALTALNKRKIKRKISPKDLECVQVCAVVVVGQMEQIEPGSVPLALLPSRDGLCSTTAPRVALALNWGCGSLLGGAGAALAAWEGWIFLGFLVGFMLAACWAR